MIELENAEVIPAAKSDSVASFPRIEIECNYDAFFRNFMEPNLPCIFPSSLTIKWSARKNWVTEDGAPNIDYLMDNFGCSDVPIAHCSKKHYNSQKKETMQLTKYVKYWKERSLDTNLDKCLYLKDWHFCRAHPDHAVYQTPQYFASDWLNEFWENRGDAHDDYKFVYLGPKGTWTPFHCDVFQSYSWSANVCGKKKWLFFPPGREDTLRDARGNLPYDITSPELGDKTLYPNAAEDVAASGLEVIQMPGETIFVPSGWYHQVWNLEDTLSINHNWINATNLLSVWRELQRELDKVEEAISDCRSMDAWESQCQLILTSTHGINYLEYASFLRVIATRRMDALNNGEDMCALDGWRQGRRHTLYDLRVLHTALRLLLDDPRYTQLEAASDSTSDHSAKLMEDIALLL